MGNGAEIDRKEVTGSDAYCDEQENNPRNDNEPRSDFGRPENAVVELKIGDPAIVLVLTILFHKGALVRGAPHIAAW